MIAARVAFPPRMTMINDQALDVSPPTMHELVGVGLALSRAARPWYANRYTADRPDIAQSDSADLRVVLFDEALRAGLRPDLI
jgi:hypothetical protein